ncbi:MAG: Asp-tRNA(Asn)/Glu-tRNA(Gln) amidotransferase subunit GatC [Candidatus Colwellbacteria bacterium]|nr:Asp-tRNA(Asn)/Glu-tRNA(Gln) amidotransferase subunit GatC [Candidatus Colwellbacteria bacterium]
MDFDIKKYAKLARMKLTQGEEEKFQKDLSEILKHVEELGKVSVKNVGPMTGGTNLKNVLREDRPAAVSVGDFEPEFPEKEKGYVRVPKVFEND